MEFPKNKNIIVISTPPTFIDEPLCPLGLIPLPILKIISFLKKHNNKLTYIDLHSGGTGETLINENVFEWKEKKATTEGKIKLKVYVSGKDFNFLEKKLSEIDKPDEFWISCSFTFDYDLVKDYIAVIRKKFPNTYIRVGGDFIRSGISDICKNIGADECFTNRIYEADISKPDFSISKKWEYGLFQLQIGCTHNCSFCVIGKDNPIKFNPNDVMEYVKEFYNLYKIKPKLF